MTTTANPTPAPADRPPLVGSDADKGRLREMVALARGYFGEAADGVLANVERVSCRYSRVGVFWKRPPTATAKAAFDLAVSQTYGTPADHFVGVRTAGGAA
jgi:hypothetical protein